MFHIFNAADRARYLRSLHRVCRPGGLVHILALSDTGPGFGPQISDTVIREAFGPGWVVEDLQPSRYRGVVTEAHAAALGRGIGELEELPARVRRV